MAKCKALMGLAVKGLRETCKNTRAQKPKPTGPSSTIITVHMTVHMIVHNCSTQYSTDKF